MSVFLPHLGLFLKNVCIHLESELDCVCMCMCITSLYFHCCSVNVSNQRVLIICLFYDTKSILLCVHFMHQVTYVHVEGACVFVCLAVTFSSQWVG